MFGYIKADRSELKGKEYELYRAVYCSLCKTLGRDYSVLMRLFLSYDATFFALLCLSLSKECPAAKSGRCRFNPLKKCNYITNEEDTFHLAAGLSVLTAYYKIIDNIDDARWLQKIPYRILKTLFLRSFKKARRRYEDIDMVLKTMTDRQRAAEADENCTVDKAAHPTAQMLHDVCGLIPRYILTETSADDEKARTTRRVLSQFGYCLGRWVYLMDAADDMEKDRKRGGFNPLLIMGIGESERKEKIEPMLNHSLSEALLSYGLLSKGRYDSIIMNVLTCAMPKEQNRVLEKTVKTPKTQKK